MMMMEVRMPRRKLDRSTFNRLTEYQNTTVCTFWLQGRCTRNPCAFLHQLPSHETTAQLPAASHQKAALQKLPAALSQETAVKRSRRSTSPDSHDRVSKQNTTDADTVSKTKALPTGGTGGGGKSGAKSDSRGRGTELSTTPSEKMHHQPSEKMHYQPSEKMHHQPSEKMHHQVCKSWITGNCVNGDKCNYLHSWSSYEDIAVKAKLRGHGKATTGIALPVGSDKLFSGSKDGTVRIWDCHTGECCHVSDFGGEEVGSLICDGSSHGSWVLFGRPNTVTAWNVHTKAGLALRGPFGQVRAMSTNSDFLLAGAQDDSIWAWKFYDNAVELAAILKGHNGAVVSLASGPKRLYSGSMDNTIKVWDIETLQCIQTLTGHSSAVTSLVFWDQKLVSSSLDKTIKIWAATEKGILEVISSLEVEHELLALMGVNDGEGKPLLLSSFSDNTVRIYNVPSFSERGRLFTEQEVQSIHLGMGGLLFTGDAMGEVTVWEWPKKPTTDVQ